MLDALRNEGTAAPVRRRRRAAAPKPANDAAPKTRSGKGAIVGVRKSKTRRMAFSPTKVETRTAVNGKPYIFARGEITYRRRSFTYTVMVPFWRHAQFADALASGNPVELEGSRQVLRIAKGKRTVDGGAYIQADRLLGVMDEAHASRGSEEPSRTLAGHERRGYYRRQRHGPGNALVKVVWIDEAKVNGGRRAA